jgi:hypothetical protein
LRAPIASNLVADAVLAGVHAGRVETLSLAPGARLALERAAGDERWFFVAAGRGQARVAGEDQPCIVVNTGAEPLLLVEVSTAGG